MKILFINHSLPYRTLRAQEALDILLMASTFDQELSVLFLDDGVLQLKTNQNPQILGLKNFAATFKAFPLYDITNIYVDEQALKDRGLTSTDLITPPMLVNTAEILAIIAQQDHIFSF